MAYQSEYGLQEHEGRDFYDDNSARDSSQPEYRDPVSSFTGLPAYHGDHTSHISPSESFEDPNPPIRYLQDCLNDPIPPFPSFQGRLNDADKRELKTLLEPWVQLPGSVLTNDPQIPPHERFNPSHRTEWKTGCRSARQKQLDYEHVKVLRDQIPKYRKYSETTKAKYESNKEKNSKYVRYGKHSKDNDATPSKEEAKWPPVKEELFWLCLSEFLPMGKDKDYLFPGGKIYGRNEKVALGIGSVLGPECLIDFRDQTKPSKERRKKDARSEEEEELSINPPRKHVSSHVQVAKKIFYVEADDPKFAHDPEWVDKESEAEKNRKRQIQWWLGTYENLDKQYETYLKKLQNGDKLPNFLQVLCPREIINQLNEHCGRHSAPSTIQDIHFELQRFSMSIRGPSTNPDDHGPIRHNFTPDTPKRMPCTYIDDARGWPRSLEPLAQMQDQGRLPAKVLLANASVDVPTKLNTHDATMVIENNLVLPERGDWQTKTQLFVAGRLQSTSQLYLATETVKIDDSKRPIYNARLGNEASYYWAQTVSEFGKMTRSSAWFHEAQAYLDRRIKSFAAVQEIFDVDPSDAPTSPPLVIYWTFQRAPPDIRGSLRWCELILPTMTKKSSPSMDLIGTTSGLTPSYFGPTDSEIEPGVDTVGGTLGSIDIFPYKSDVHEIAGLWGGSRDQSQAIESSGSSQTLGQTEQIATANNLGFHSPSMSFDAEAVDPALSQHSHQAPVALPGLGHIPQGHAWLSQYTYPGPVASQYSNGLETQPLHRRQTQQENQSNDNTCSSLSKFFETEVVTSGLDPHRSGSFPEQPQVSSLRSTQTGHQGHLELPEQHQVFQHGQVEKANHPMFPAFSHASPIQSFSTPPEFYPGAENIHASYPAELNAMPASHDQHRDHESHCDSHLETQSQDLQYIPNHGNADNLLYYTSQRLQQHQNQPLYPANPYLYLFDTPHFLQSHISNEQQQREHPVSTLHSQVQQSHSHAVALQTYTPPESQTGSETTTPTEALSFDCGNPQGFGGFPNITLLSQHEPKPHEDHEQQQSHGYIIGEANEESKLQDMDIDAHTSAGGDWTMVDHPQVDDGSTELNSAFGEPKKGMDEEEQALAAAFDPGLLEAEKGRFEGEVEMGEKHEFEREDMEHQRSNQEHTPTNGSVGALLPSAIE